MARPAGVAACALLGACAGPYYHDTRADAPVLPAVLGEHIPLTVGVSFPAGFGAAVAENAFITFGDKHIYRHAVGAASVATLRTVLAGSFAGVVEMGDGAVGASAAAAAVLVPGLPSMGGAALPNDLLVNFRQSIEYPLELRSTTGETLAQWTVTGRVATGLYANWLTAQKGADAAMLRNAAADLVASLWRDPARAALAALGAPMAPRARAEPRTFAERGLVVLRLDAGLAHEDALEMRVGACLKDALPAPRGLAGANPAGTLRDALFPWFEPWVVPLEAPAIADLLATRLVRDRLEGLGVSHMLLFTAREGARKVDNNLGCVAGFGAGACIGMIEEKTSYAIEATLWNAGAARALGDARADVTRSVGAIGVLIPIPFFSSDEAEGCQRLQRFVRESLAPR